jgi:hypothetical protein
MTNHRPPIDPSTAERLIRDARADEPSADPLARLLAAAATPARPGELTDEDAAVAAFRHARLTRAPRRRSLMKTALAKLATAKVAVAVIALGGGGIALAAGSGHLPGTTGSNQHASASPEQTSSNGHRADPSAAASSRSSHPRPNQTSPEAVGPSNAKGSPSPNLHGLCTAYTAQLHNNPGKALDNPAFTALINAAGGKDRVAGYCATLLGPPNGQPAHGTPSPHPTHPTHPIHPTHPPTKQPR